MKKLISFLLAVFMSLALVIPALAQSENASENVPSSSVDSAKLACVAAAVDKREVAVAAAYGVFSASATSILAVRRSSLAAAWVMTDKKARNVAVRTAWKTFVSSVKDARKVLKVARKDAWKTFKTEAKACRAGDVGGESEGADNI